MKNQDNLILTQTDFDQLSLLVDSVQTQVAGFLEEELSRAAIVSDKDLPSDVVSMNSMVVFKDLDTDKEMPVTLVYPRDARIEDNKISILAPVGSALIGLRVGQVINWPMPNGRVKKLQVISVLFQPENS